MLRLLFYKKSGKNKTEFNQAYLNSTTEIRLKTGELKAIKSNSDLFKFMNERQLIFVEIVLEQSTN